MPSFCRNFEDPGFHNQMPRWVEQVFVRHRMYVAICGCNKDDAHVLSGVPQGSVLGPLLLLINVDAVASDTISTLYAFTDDHKLYISYS